MDWTCDEAGRKWCCTETRLYCTKPGKNGDVGEADQSWGGANRYRRTAQGFGAEIGGVAEAHWGDQVPPRDVIPVEEEEEEEENIRWEKRGYDTVNWIEACDSILEWEVFVVMALMFLVKGQRPRCSWVLRYSGFVRCLRSQKIEDLYRIFDGRMNMKCCTSDSIDCTYQWANSYHYRNCTNCYINAGFMVVPCISDD